MDNFNHLFKTWDIESLKLLNSQDLSYLKNREDSSSILANFLRNFKLEEESLEYDNSEIIKRFPTAEEISQNIKVRFLVQDNDVCGISSLSHIISFLKKTPSNLFVNFKKDIEEIDKSLELRNLKLFFENTLKFRQFDSLRDPYFEYFPETDRTTSCTIVYRIKDEEISVLSDKELKKLSDLFLVSYNYKSSSFKKYKVDFRRSFFIKREIFCEKISGKND